MIQQQTTEAEVEAARVRVTPGELAQATAIVEARRDAEAKHLSDTIALGEAVQQLGLAATPEELFAEVQALRANSPQNKAEVAEMSAMLDQKEAERQTAWLVGFTVCSLLLVAGVLIPLNNIPASSTTGASYEPSSQMMYLQAINAAQNRSLPSTPASMTASATTSTTASTIASTDAEQVRKLNPGLFQSLDLKEGQSAHCSMKEIQSLARGANPAQIWVTKKAGEQTWHLTRRAGKFCVQCYTTSAEAVKIVNGQSAVVRVYADGDTEVPITMPLNKFANPSSSELQQGSDGSVIQVQVN